MGIFTKSYKEYKKMKQVLLHAKKTMSGWKVTTNNEQIIEGLSLRDVRQMIKASRMTIQTHTKSASGMYEEIIAK
jgi:hypothetical protein